MKNLLLLIAFFITSFSFAQTDTTYFSVASGKCAKEQSDYYRIISKSETGYLVKDLFMKNNLPKMTAMCSAVDPVVYDGKCTFYNEQGQKDHEGIYVKDKMIGIWTSWYEDGDSSVVECRSNGTYQNIRVTEKQTFNNLFNVFYPIEIMPEFVGGMSALMKFIKKNVTYPEDERKAEIEGTCYITFFISKRGGVTDAQLLRGVMDGPGCDKEALRVVNLMPDWTPGMLLGKPLRVQFNLPIKFNL